MAGIHVSFTRPPTRTANLDLKWIRQPHSLTLPARAKHSLRLVDLFCGCGGLSLGVREGARFQRRGLQVCLAVDTNPVAVEVYRANHQGTENTARVDDVGRLFPGDLRAPRTGPERYWSQKIGKVDLLVAGPPCQGHSDLNNLTRRDDPRNQLYLRTVRACQVLRPKVVIIENVPAVLRDRTKVVDRAEEELVRVGYHVSDGFVHLGHFGVPQSRKRHVLLAVLKIPIELSDIQPPLAAIPTVQNYLLDIENEHKTRKGLFYQMSNITPLNQSRIDYLFDNDLYDLPNELRPPCHRDNAHTYKSMYGRMNLQKPSQTITSGFGSMGQGRYVHPTQRRLLTAHEAARLQGFPDFFDFSRVPAVTALREMIANAVPPQFTSFLVSELIEAGVL